MWQRGNPLELEVGTEYTIYNGRVFCIVEFKKKKYKASGTYADFMKRTDKEKQALLLEYEGYMTVAYKLLETEEVNA